VEGEGGYFRRNHLVPVPQVGSWEELNVLLREGSKQDSKGESEGILIDALIPRLKTEIPQSCLSRNSKNAEASS
jgi:hypothetical protein